MAKILEGGGGSGTALTSGEKTLAEREAVYPDAGYNGYVVVSKKPTLIHSWDFTKSLIDSVGGLEAVLYNGASQDAAGLLISGATQYIEFPVAYKIRRTYEFDVSGIENADTSGHRRLFMVSGDEGLILQSNTTWNCFIDRDWSKATGGTAENIISGKTVTIKAGIIEEYKTYGGAEKRIARWKLLLDGVEWFTTDVGHYDASENITFGSPRGNSLRNVRITGFRIYDGVTY